MEGHCWELDLQYSQRAQLRQPLQTSRLTCRWSQIHANVYESTFLGLLLLLP